MGFFRRKRTDSEERGSNSKDRDKKPSSRASSPGHRSSRVDDNYHAKKHKKNGCPPDNLHPYLKTLPYKIGKYKFNLTSRDFSQTHRWIDIYNEIKPSQLGVEGEEKSYDFWQVGIANRLQFMDPETGEPKDKQHYTGKRMKYRVGQGDVYITNTIDTWSYEKVKNYFTYDNRKMFPNNSEVSMQCTRDGKLIMTKIHRAGQIERYYPYGRIDFVCHVVNQLPHDLVWNDVCGGFEVIYGRHLCEEVDSNDNQRHLQRWVLSWGSDRQNVVANRLRLKNEGRDKVSGRPKDGSHRPGQLERYYLPGMDLGSGQDGRSIMMPNSEALPPELRVLTSAHYILNDSNKPWSWEELAQLLVRSIAIDSMASSTRDHRSAARTPITQWIADTDNHGNLQLVRAPGYTTNTPAKSFSARTIKTLDRPEHYAAVWGAFTYTGFDYRAWSHDPNCDAKVFRYTGKPYETRGWHRQHTEVTYYSMPITNRYDRDLNWHQVAERLVKLNKEHDLVLKPSSEYFLRRGRGNVLVLTVGKKPLHEIIRDEDLYRDERPSDGWLRKDMLVTVYIGRDKIRLTNQHECNSVWYDTIYDKLAQHYAKEGRIDHQATISTSSTKGYVKLVFSNGTENRGALKFPVEQRNHQPQDNRNQAHTLTSTEDTSYQKSVPSQQRRSNQSHSNDRGHRRP